MSRRVITTPLSVAGYQTRCLTRGFASPSHDGFALSRRSLPCAKEFCARKVPSVDGFEPERVTMCDRGRASRRVEYESATTARRPSVT